MAEPKVLRGADIKVYVNGLVVGVATAARWEATDGRHAIYGIDQYTPFELAPGQCDVRGTIELVRLRLDGGLEGRGIHAPESKIMLEKYFALALVDRTTDSAILVIDNAAVNTQNWQVTAKGEVTGSFTFEGLAWTNETGI